MSDLPNDAIPGGDDPDAGLDPDLTEDIEADDSELDPDDGADPPEPGDDDPQDEPDPHQQRERQGRRTQSQRLRERQAATARENAELRGRLEALERGRQQPAYDPAAQQRAAAEELERLRLMDPVEAAIQIRNQSTQQMQHALLMERLNFQDQLDRRDYERETRGGNKIYQRYQAEVERTLAAQRNAGNLGATRSGILEQLVGRDALARAGRVAPAQRARAGQRVAAQQVRPGSGRGDVARGTRAGRDQASQDERLLRSVTVDEV